MITSTGTANTHENIKRAKTTISHSKGMEKVDSKHTTGGNTNFTNT